MKTSPAMDCAAFLRWLDQGRPEGFRTAAEEHRASCHACARAFEAEAEVEGLLAARAAPAPAGFTGAVMARIASPATEPRAVLEAPALPWWIRAAMEPPAVLALAVAALLAWRWSALWSAAMSLGAAAGAGAARMVADSASAASATPGLRLLGRDDVILALGLGLGSLLIALLPTLFRSAPRHTVPGPR